MTRGSPLRIGLLSPGAMGAAVGAQLVAAGHRVGWASDGRGAATTERARAAGLDDDGSVGRLVAASEVVLSIVPPQHALETAAQVAAAGFTGLYLDANAVAPGTALEVGRLLVDGGAGCVDGGLVGPPPGPGRPVRLYLSGGKAERIADAFAGTEVEAIVLGSEPGAASALKLAYAAWTKGSAALLLASHELAERSGVVQALEAEWERSQPELAGRLRGARSSAASKGWRWAPEMREIAAFMRAEGLPGGFHEAAAAIFEVWPRSDEG